MHAPRWFESLLWGASSGLPVANRFDLLGSESILGISQDPPMCTRTALRQDGFDLRGLWIVSIP